MPKNDDSVRGENEHCSTACTLMEITRHGDAADSTQPFVRIRLDFDLAFEAVSNAAHCGAAIRCQEPININMVRDDTGDSKR